MANFKKFARQQFSSLNQHLANYLEKRESGDLHKIRVDIKKIKATLGFINHSVKGFKAHQSYIPLRRIFRRAGEIREPEILNELLLTYNGQRRSRNLIKVSHNLKEPFCEDVPSFIYLVNKQWVTIKPFAEKLRRKDVRKFLKKTAKGIKTKLYPKPDMKLIHRARKLIKSFIYLSKAGDHTPKRLMKFYANEVEKIGELHDRQVLLNMLARQNRPDTRIKAIRKECNRKKDEIRKYAHAFYGR